MSACVFPGSGGFSQWMTTVRRCRWTWPQLYARHHEGTADACRPYTQRLETVMGRRRPLLTPRRSVTTHSPRGSRVSRRPPKQTAVHDWYVCDRHSSWSRTSERRRDDQLARPGRCRWTACHTPYNALPNEVNYTICLHPRSRPASIHRHRTICKHRPTNIRHCLCNSLIPTSTLPSTVTWYLPVPKYFQSIVIIIAKSTKFSIRCPVNLCRVFLVFNSVRLYLLFQEIVFGSPSRKFV